MKKLLTFLSTLLIILISCILIITPKDNSSKIVDTIIADNSKPTITISIPSIKNDIQLYEKTKKLTKEFTEQTTSTEKTKIGEIDGFVLLEEMDKDFVIDMRYATTNNFTKQKVYPSAACILRKETAVKLVKANEELKKQGYRIKIWDAYRPIYVQKIFWDIVKDSRFVANPDKGGSIHNKGCAVDITLVDKEGKELDMPSKFDDFSEKAYRNNQNMTKEAKKNMDLLTAAMVNNGFSIITTEWWHFVDTNSKNFQAVDLDLNSFNN